MRKGIRLAIDYGDSRIGLAKSDNEGILASPLETLANDANCVQKIVSEIPENCLEIYVGLPLNLMGEMTAATTKAITFTAQLSVQANCPVRLIDERLSTALANSQLREIGKSQKSARGHIDQMAAVAILEYALSMERNTGNIPGEPVGKWVETSE